MIINIIHINYIRIIGICEFLITFSNKENKHL